MLGHLRGLSVAFKCSSNWFISTLNPRSTVDAVKLEWSGAGGGRGGWALARGASVPVALKDSLCRGINSGSR